jgi:hypothetical protein
MLRIEGNLAAYSCLSPIHGVPRPYPVGALLKKNNLSFYRPPTSSLPQRVMKAQGPASEARESITNPVADWLPGDSD